MGILHFVQDDGSIHGVMLRRKPKHPLVEKTIRLVVLLS
jgi:hypothetical protein